MNRVHLGDDVTSCSLECANSTSSPSSRPLFTEVASQLRAYFDGRLTEFDVPLMLDGTPFQRTVWAALLRIPYGRTVSYRELAERLSHAGHPHPGRPTAARAVGLANGRNPIAIIVPCHRVVGAAFRGTPAPGSCGTPAPGLRGLVGYGGGLDRKRRLLEFERHGNGLFGSRTGTFGN